jgi:hypothetical protein
MASDLVSAKSRQEFREYFVSISLARIQDAFAAEGFQPDRAFQPSVGGQRRVLVEQYYQLIDWRSSTEVNRLLRVFEAVLVELELEASTASTNSEWARKTAAGLRRWLARDGIAEESGRLVLPGHRSIDEALSSIDAPELQRQIDRMRASVDEDPGLAVGTSKELIETVCKTILVAHGMVVDSNWDAPRLVKETREVLALLPPNTEEAVKGADTIRRLLGNLGAVVQGLAELRNLYGTGHGKHGRAKGVLPRHARLAVGAAATLATFLLETHNARRS